MCSYSETWQFICPVTELETDLFNAVFCTAKIYSGQDLEYTSLKFKLGSQRIHKKKLSAFLEEYTQILAALR